jgi:tetratricopeptide (TPR) repeat protein
MRLAALTLTLTLFALPAAAQSLDERARICAGRVGDYNAEQRSDACTTVIDSGAASPQMMADAYNARGNLYRGQGAYLRAVVDYNQAIRYAPDYANAFANRASAYAGHGDHDRAILDYSQSSVASVTRSARSS